jgi:hypothetical protein
MYFARLRICCSTAELLARRGDEETAGRELVKLGVTIV